MKKKKAFIVTPSYNERENLKELIPHIFKITENIKGWDVHILVADDQSPDGTADAVRELQKKYKRNLHLILGNKEGIGKAYLRAFTHAIDEWNPYVLFEMDADGQHDPSIIPNFLEEIENGADFVIGSRYIKGGSIPSHWALWRKFISIIGNIVAQLGFMNFKVRDWTSGYRAIKAHQLKKLIPEMEKSTGGYVFQVELLDRAIKKHMVIRETPLVFADRVDGESKMQSFQYMYDTLLYIFFNSSFIRFVITGFLGFGVDFGSAAGLIGIFDMYKPTANAISAEIAIISNFLINNYWSFSHKKIEGSMLRKFVKFNLVSSGSIFIQWFGMKLALESLGDHLIYFPFLSIPSWVVYKVLIIALFVIPYSYIMYNTFIWKAPKR